MRISPSLGKKIDDDILRLAPQRARNPAMMKTSPPPLSKNSDDDNASPSEG